MDFYFTVLFGGHKSLTRVTNFSNILFSKVSSPSNDDVDVLACKIETPYQMSYRTNFVLLQSRKQCLLRLMMIHKIWWDKKLLSMLVSLKRSQMSP